MTKNIRDEAIILMQESTLLAGEGIKALAKAIQNWNEVWENHIAALRVAMDRLDENQVDG